MKTSSAFFLTPVVFLSLITRGARFFLIAALINKFGAPIQDFIEKRLNLVATAFLVLLVAGFAVVTMV